MRSLIFRELPISQSVNAWTIYTFVFLLFPSLVFSQGNASVVANMNVAPAIENHFGYYSFTLDINQNPRGLIAGQSTISVVFPNNTILPSTIDNNLILINGISASGISVNGQTVTITSPTNIDRNSDPALIEFLAQSQIINPPSGTYSLSISTSSGDNNLNSGNYVIAPSTSTISQPSVVPSPTRLFQPAAYTVSFNLGSGGFLTTSDIITLEFPLGATVPQGQLSGVTINGIASVAVGIGNRQIQITPAVMLPNSAFVTINFPLASGLRNPDAAQNHVLRAKTSKENIWVNSANILISSNQALSFSAIALSNDRVNASTSFTISFNVGEGGALQANADFIELQFPNGAQIPSLINPSLISLQNTDGFTDSPNSVVAVNSNTLRMQTSLPVAENTELSISISEGLGILNPAVPGNYQLTARLLNQSLQELKPATPSNSYAVSASPNNSTRASVLLGTPNSNQNTTYTMAWNTGSFGRLFGGESVITVEFPSGTNVTSASFSLNGTNIPNGNVTKNGTMVTIALPSSVSVASGATATLVGSSIRNPNTSGTFTLSISSSAEPVGKNSFEYAIGSQSMNVTFINANPLNVNTNAQIQFGVSNAGTYRRGNNDYFRVIFPEGFVVPDGITPAQITMNADNGTSITDVVSNSNDRSVTIYVTRGNNSNFGVYGFTFSTAAGIINPPVPTSNNGTNSTLDPNAYRILVSSSQRPVPAQSSSINIQPVNGSNITFSEMILSPSTQNASNVDISMRINTAANGRLIGGTGAGSNFVQWNIFYNIVGPASIDPSSVTVNGYQADVVERANASTYRVYIPEGVEIPPSSQFEIRFLASAGFANGGNTGNATFSIKSDAAYGSSNGSATITSAANVPTTFDALTLSSSLVNAPSAYTIKFTPGTNFGLAQDDVIRITFPNNTFVPSSILASRILVNGIQPTLPVTRENSRTLLIPVPQAISAGNQATIQISNQAGILNPTLAGSDYSLGLQVPGDVVRESPLFSTFAANSATSIATVSLSNPDVQQPAATGVTSNYLVAFSTGSNGRFLAGTSTITIEFPNGTGVNPTSVTINGTNATFSANGAQRRVVATVPASVSILNNSPVNVRVNGLTNPATESNNYSVNVFTSVEPQSVTSNPYVISNVGPIRLISVTPTRNVVNDSLLLSVFFEIGQNFQTNGNDFITLFMPDFINLPSAVPPSGSFIINVLNSDNLGDVPTQTITVSSPATIVYNSRAIRIPVNANIASGQRIEVQVLPTSGFLNPREPETNYVIGVSTSKQQIRVDSEEIEFLPSFTTFLSSLVVTRTSDIANSPNQWNWSFITGSRGALQPGFGKITMIYPNNFVNFPSTIDVSAVTVNGSRSRAVEVGSNSITVTVPNDVTIGILTEVNVVIKADALITLRTNQNKQVATENPTLLSEEYFVSTSSEPTSVNGSGNSLPVELIYFGVEKSVQGFLNNPVAILKWSTLSEYRNYGFTVERKRLEAKTSVWEEIGFVNGAGTAYEQKDYSFEDSNVGASGTYSYRLIQVDYDGKFTIYNESQVEFEAPNETKLLPNYPNPFNPSTTIVFQLSKVGPLRLEIFDLLGRSVATLVDEQEMPSGIHNVIFDASKLSSGMYIARIASGSTVHTKQIVLVK